MSTRKILDRPLTKTRNEVVSLHALSFLFSEALQYHHKRVKGIEELEDRLSQLGFRVGVRLYELILWRDTKKREPGLLPLLIFCNTTLWKTMFGKPCDALEKGTDRDDEYMLHENDPVLIRYISVPKEISTLNCMAFVAGILEACLHSAGYKAKVTAHSTGSAEFPNRTTLLIKI